MTDIPYEAAWHPSRFFCPRCRRVIPYSECYERNGTWLHKPHAPQSSNGVLHAVTELPDDSVIVPGPNETDT